RSRDVYRFQVAVPAGKSIKQEVVEELPLYQFLQLAGLITPKDIEKALKIGSRNTELMARMLLLAEAMESGMLDSAVRLHRLISVGALKADQSLMAMGICQNRRCTLEQAFKSLGWTVPDADGKLTAESVEALRKTTGQFKALSREQAEIMKREKEAADRNGERSPSDKVDLSITTEIPVLNSQKAGDPTAADTDSESDRRKKRLSDLIP
ncbi:MAG: hypothetical protein K2Z81_07355, partial [Cyanobacteria bacterium]|nr:hypothetical protein [Cyanobacteriota bacterium]